MAVDPARSFERRGALRRVEPSVLVPQVAARAEQKGQVDEDLADVLTGAPANSCSTAVSRRMTTSSRASSRQSLPAISRCAAWTASAPRPRGPSVIGSPSSAPLTALP
ncbi:hypothetical protein [Streptomyces koyangensis]